MTLLGLQQKGRRLGKIRLGVKGPKGEPKKLTTLRFTSPRRAYVEAVAQAFGGTVEPWASPDGPQWQVITDRDAVPIAVPPGHLYSAWYERWTGGGAERRCDGVKDQISGGPCLCAQEVERTCKPTSRLDVMLPDIPGIGVWALSSTGVNAAMELPATVELMQRAMQAGIYLTGELRIEQRTSRKDGKVNRFVVPVVDLDMTMGQLMEASQNPQALGPGPQQAIAPPTRAALPSSAALPEVHEGRKAEPTPGFGEAPPLPTTNAVPNAAAQQERDTAPASAPASSGGGSSAPPESGPHKDLPLVDQVAADDVLRAEFLTAYGIDHTDRLKLTLVGALLRGAKVPNALALLTDAGAQGRAHNALEKRFGTRQRTGVAAAAEGGDDDPESDGAQPAVKAIATLRDGTRRWSVASHTTAGLRYEVARHRDGWSCECPDFVCRQKGQTGELCKHIAQILELIGERFEEAMAAEAPADDDPFARVVRRCNWCDAEWTGIGMVCETCVQAEEDARRQKTEAPA